MNVLQLIEYWEQTGFADSMLPWYRIIRWRRRYTGKLESLEEFRQAEMQ